VPQKVLADHPYTFVKPLPNVDTTSSKIIQHQPSKNTYNIAPDSFHRRERSGLFLDHHQDQMAVETNLKERKVDQISERMDKLKRRRIEINPDHKERKSKAQQPPSKMMKMPDFPNFPLIPIMPPQNNLNLTLQKSRGEKSNNNNINNHRSGNNTAENLPKPLPLKMTDLKESESRFRGNSRPLPSQRRRLPVNLTPNKKNKNPFRNDPAPVSFNEDYYFYYDDDYYYDDDDYYEELINPSHIKPATPKISKPVKSKPKVKIHSHRSPPRSPPRSPSLEKWVNKSKNPPRKVLRPPPKMSDIKSSNPKMSPVVKRRLKNHRLPPPPPPPAETFKSDRFNSPNSYTSSSTSSQNSPSAPEALRSSSVLEASPSKKNRFVDYEYYDDYVYYDYDVVPSTPKRIDRPRRRQYGGGGGGINPLALLVAPLAAISLLAAAAAVAINPVLVQVSFTGKRRKRSLNGEPDEDEAEWNPEIKEKMHEMEVLERFLGTIPENRRYQQQILSMYLTCSGYTETSNKCLDRVVCDYSNVNSDIPQDEKDVISIILYNIMANDFVNEEYKDRLRTSARIGRDHDQGSCSKKFVCSELDMPSQDE